MRDYAEREYEEDSAGLHSQTTAQRIGVRLCLSQSAALASLDSIRVATNGRPRRALLLYWVRFALRIELSGSKIRRSMKQADQYAILSRGKEHEDGIKALASLRKLRLVLSAQCQTSTRSSRVSCTHSVLQIDCSSSSFKTGPDIECSRKCWYSQILNAQEAW